MLHGVPFTDDLFGRQIKSGGEVRQPYVPSGFVEQARQCENGLVKNDYNHEPLSAIQKCIAADSRCFILLFKFVADGGGVASVCMQ
jgi:hypothetical protein